MLGASHNKVISLVIDNSNKNWITRGHFNCWLISLIHYTWDRFTRNPIPNEKNVVFIVTIMPSYHSTSKSIRIDWSMIMFPVKMRKFGSHCIFTRVHSHSIAFNLQIWHRYNIVKLEIQPALQISDVPGLYEKNIPMYLF